MEVAPPVADALRVGGPYLIANAERLEERPAREIVRAHPGRPGDDRRKQVQPAAPIIKLSPRLLDHRKVQRESHPVGALLHLPQTHLSVLELAIEAPRHGE